MLGVGAAETKTATQQWRNSIRVTARLVAERADSKLLSNISTMTRRSDAMRDGGEAFSSDHRRST